jgi:hypothetical protein
MKNKKLKLRGWVKELLVEIVLGIEFYLLLLAFFK